MPYSKFSNVTFRSPFSTSSMVTLMVLPGKSSSTSSGHSMKQRAPAVEVIFVPHVIHFFQFLDAVEVKMVNQFTGSVGTVFVDNGESRGGDDVGNAQLLANGFDESRLARPHFSIEGEDGIVTHFSDELAGGFVNLV